MFAGKNELNFEPKMPVAMDATGETETPPNMRPIQGPLVAYRYKPTTWRYNVRLSAAPTVGSASLELKANGVVIKTIALALNGITQLDGQTPISLSGVDGDAPLSVNVNVTTPLDAGITAQVDSIVSCDIPPSSAGGC